MRGVVHSQKERTSLKIKFLSLAVFIGAFSIFLYNAAPSVTTGDSGEFMTASATLSLPHAPSFPLYTVSSRVFCDLLPFGSKPYKRNVFSSFLAALTVMFVFLLGVLVSENIFLSLAVSATLMTSSSFFENALVTEVFSLNSFILGLMLFFIFKGLEVLNKSQEENAFKQFCVASLLLGLGMTNHQTILVAAFLFVPILFLYFRQSLNPRSLTFLTSFFLIGLSLYFILPLRSSKEPPLNWGKPTTIERFYRTLTRKDYGSLKLTIDKSPDRTLENTVKQTGQFFKQMALEVSWPVLLLGLIGLGLGLREKKKGAVLFTVLFLISGPGFFLLSNLPFDFQSVGVMGRFMIMPLFAVIAGFLFFPRSKKIFVTLMVPFLVFMSVKQALATWGDHRHFMMVWDYGQEMLKIMPEGSALFMDGGDDAFYSLAMLQNVLGKRKDLELHDRGGLVFKNVYGDDFRILTKEAKTLRRQAVERTYLDRRRVYYSTMEPKILPDVPSIQQGFLFETSLKESNPISLWPRIVIRSLYPLTVQNYRTKALACFFPFMEGKELMSRNKVDEALLYWDKARAIGNTIDWLNQNLETDYVLFAYQQFQSGHLVEAEKIYRSLLKWKPNHQQAMQNLGVVYLRQGRTDDAKAQYLKCTELFPTAADGFYNIAVLEWQRQNWGEAQKYLELTLKVAPTHMQAQHYLQVLIEKQKNGGRI